MKFIKPKQCFLWFQEVIFMIVSNQVVLGIVSDATYISFMSPRFFSVLPPGLKYLNKKKNYQHDSSIWHVLKNFKREYNVSFVGIEPSYNLFV